MTNPERGAEALRTQAVTLFEKLRADLGQNPNFLKIAQQAALLREQIGEQGFAALGGLDGQQIKLLEAVTAIYLAGDLDLPAPVTVATAEPEM